jgi:hypothetical protein
MLLVNEELNAPVSISSFPITDAIEDRPGFADS